MPESEAPSPPSVYEHIAMMLDGIASVSWQKLGLQPDPFSGKLEPNLTEARVAIDLAAHFLTILEPQLEDEDRRRAQSLLKDLRINFVQKSKEASLE